MGNWGLSRLCKVFVQNVSFLEKSSHFSYSKQIENVFQRFGFQMCSFCAVEQCVGIVCWYWQCVLLSSVLALFRASSKYNVKLRYLTGRCQIAALCCLYRLLWTVLAVKLFLGFFGLQYLIIAFFKFCILARYNLFQLGKL